VHLVLSTLISFDDEQKLRSLSLYDFLHFLFARDVRTFSSLVFVTNVNHCWIEGPSFTRQQEEETILWSENFAFLVFCFFFFFLFSSSVSSRPLWTSTSFLPSASSCFYFFIDFCFLLHLFPIPQTLLRFLYCLSPEVGLFSI
jgi:hypothetical protein